MNRAVDARRVVITGFGAFPGVPENPTSVLVDHLRNTGDSRCEYHLLPVTYAGSEAMLTRIFADPPSVLVMTGFSHASKGLRLETGALDCRDPAFPDAEGVTGPEGAEPGETLANRTIDFAGLEARLHKAGVAAELSGDAGRYVCNHLYYGALHRAADGFPRTRALFVHIPAIVGTPLARDSAAAMELDEMARGIATIVDALA